MADQIQLTVTYNERHGIIQLSENGKLKSYSCTREEALEIAEGCRNEYDSNSPGHKAEMIEVRKWLNQPHEERVQQITDRIVNTIKSTACCLMGKEVSDA